MVISRTGHFLRSLWSDRALRGGSLSVFDQAVVSGTALATSVLLGRLTSPAVLGVYYLALSVVLFLRGVQEQVVSAPYTVYRHRFDGRELAAYTGGTFIHQAVLSMLAVGGIGLVVAGAGGGGATWPSLIGPAVLAALPFVLLREHVRQLSFAHFHVTTVIALDSAVAILQISGLVLLAVCGGLTVAGVYTVMGAACAVACAGWFFVGGQPVRFNLRQALAAWRRNWPFGRWMLAGHLVGSSATYLMPWLVAAVKGAAQTGVMAACNTLAGLANAFVTGVCNFLSPQAAAAFARGGVGELRRVLRKTAAIFLVTLGGFSAVMLAAGEWLAVTVYGGQFAGAGPIIAVYALALLAGSLAVTAGNGLCAMDRPSANFAADVAALVVTAAAAAILVPPLGVLGAAVATLCGNTAEAAVRFAILVRLMRAVS